MMKKFPSTLRLYFFAAITLLSLRPSAELHAQQASPPWSRSELLLAGTYLGGSLIDAGQTIYGISNGAVELNPIFGPSPSRKRIYTLKTLFGLGALYLAHHAPQARERRTLLVVMNIIQWSAVLWNGMQPGIGVRLHF